MRKDVVETWRRCRALWTAARVRLGVDDELAVFQSALARQVRASVTRTRGGTTYLPTGAYVRLHPRDAVLFRSFRRIVQSELDAELAALYAGLPDVRFTGCRISVAPDETVPRWCPLVEVDWLPATRVMPPSTLAAPQVRRAARHRLATVQIRPGGSAPC